MPSACLLPRVTPDPLKIRESPKSANLPPHPAPRLVPRSSIRIGGVRFSSTPRQPPKTNRGALSLWHGLPPAALARLRKSAHGPPLICERAARKMLRSNEKAKRHALPEEREAGQWRRPMKLAESRICIDCRNGDCDSCYECWCDCNMKFAHRLPKKLRLSAKVRKATKR